MSENEVVNCALKLRPAFAQIVSHRGLSVETELEIGIGSGQVVTGTFGHRSLLQWDVFGEEVNRAATIGHHRGIAITERVHDESSRTIRFAGCPISTSSGKPSL